MKPLNIYLEHIHVYGYFILDNLIIKLEFNLVTLWAIDTITFFDSIILFWTTSIIGLCLYGSYSFYVSSLTFHPLHDFFHFLETRSTNGNFFEKQKVLQSNASRLYLSLYPYDVYVLPIDVKDSDTFNDSILLEEGTSFRLFHKKRFDLYVSHQTPGFLDRSQTGFRAYSGLEPMMDELPSKILKILTLEDEKIFQDQFDFSPIRKLHNVILENFFNMNTPLDLRLSQQQRYHLSLLQDEWLNKSLKYHFDNNRGVTYKKSNQGIRSSRRLPLLDEAPFYSEIKIR
jgi:hypothetical protein